MNKEMPLVTIVTVTYNLIKSGREKYFKQCLESVHNQSYSTFEHLIIDGSSTDGTLEIVKEYADKGWVRYISEPDTGIYNAMNKGLKKARGKYIAFLNSDDYYQNIEAINLSVRALENKGADFSYANFIVLGDNQKYIEKGEIERFLYVMPFGHPTVFAKRTVLLKEGGFNEYIGLPADYDLFIRLILKNYSAVYINSEIVTYRLGGEGVINDYSASIADIYFNNYSDFYTFLNRREATKIMYDRVIPKDFAQKFYNYANSRKLNNINLDKVMLNLRELKPRKRTEALLEKLKRKFRRYPLLRKLWRLIKNANK